MTDKRFETVVVTGGAGFLGSHLVDALVSVSKKVVVIDKKKPRARQKNALAKYVIADIAHPGTEQLVASYKPEVIFHLAAHIHDRESMREPVMNAENNIVGSLHVFEAARAVSKTRVVFASSSVVYGNQEQIPIVETATPMPLTPYAISQLACEQYLRFYFETFQVPYTVLRMANVYGPRQDESAESGAVGIFAARFLKGEPVYINNDGSTTRDYVYIADAVDALLRAAHSSFIGIVNVGSGVEVETNAVFERVREAVGVQAAPDYREQIQDAVKRVALDIHLIGKTFDWSPTVSLEEGILKTVEWYRENA